MTALLPTPDIAAPGISGWTVTPGQRRVWFLSQLGEDGGAFQLVVVARVGGRLRPQTVRAALAALAGRHPVLHSRFLRHPWGEVEQRIETEAALDCAVADLSALPADRLDGEIARLAAAEGTRPFDLNRPGLLRTTLVNGGSGTALVLCAHRLVADETAMTILAADLLALCLDEEPPPPPAASFADHARALAAAIEDGGLAARLEQCRARLGGETPVLELPRVQPRGVTRHHRSAKTAITAPLGGGGDGGDGDDAVAIAAIATLLFRYGGQADIRLGVPLPAPRSGRDHGVVGPLDNTAVLRLRLSGAVSFAEVVAQTRRELALAMAHRDLPFDLLVDELHADRFQAVAPLFQVMVRRRGRPLDLHWPRSGRRARVEPPESQGQTCELVFEHDADGMVLRYGAEQFRQPAMERMLGHAVRLWRRLLAAPDRPVAAHPLLEAAEVDRLSAPWPFAPVAARPVHRLIEEQARRRPGAPAVIFGESTLSLGELERRANRLAHRLVHLGAGPESRVGVALERSPDMIVALLAVLKANAAFVPLDPDYPAERLAYIVADAGIGLLLTQEHLRPRLPHADGVATIALDRLDLTGESQTPPPAPTHPDQLAYVIYTSGSTGQPKGVEVAHGPLSMHCQATAELYEIDADTRELHFLSISFDGAHERWMVPLIRGGAVVLRGPALWSAAETFVNMRRHQVTNAGFPTAYFTQLAEWAAQRGEAPPVRLYSFGGEAMPRATFDLARRTLRPRWLINGYGPTEAVISPMAWKSPAETGFAGTYAPIGRAVGERRAYVLDPDLNPLPVGVTGELYLGGSGLARGYRGRPSATAERFVPDPFANDGGRLYRTGDLARWLDDGTVEYLGRADTQVKLRGFRIELGEIEARLRDCPAIADAVAVLDPDGPRLLGYVVGSGAAIPDPAALRAELGRGLPEYMVPAAIVVLERMPVTANGKVDRQALPKPPPGGGGDAVAPATPTEERIAAVWCQELKLDRVGVTHNFFDLGGDSLSALRIVGRLREAFPDKRVGVIDLFNNPEIRLLALSLEEETVGTTQVVHMRKGGANPMLYCFPGLLVSTRDYGGLVRHLGDDQPATGFICHSLSDSCRAEASVEELAAGYAGFIRDNTPGGECFLLGWSWGGILAYEAARMLTGQVDIKFVGMLDVCALDAEFAPQAEATLAAADRRRLQHDIDTWLGRTAMRREWEDLLARMDAKVYTQFLRYVRKSKESLPLDGPEIGSREHIFLTLMQNALVFRDYVMTASDCPIHAWIAEDSITRGMNVIDWRHYSPRTERVEVIHGTTHLEIIHSRAFHQSFADSVAQSLGRR